MKAQAPTTADLSTLLGKILEVADGGYRWTTDGWRFERIAALAREAQQADLTERLERSIAKVQTRFVEVKRSCGHWTEVSVPVGQKIDAAELRDSVCSFCDECGILEGR